MQWRPLVLLLTGIAMIYVASLLQVTPYPHPKKIVVTPTSLPLSSRTRQQQLPPPDATLLTLSDTHVYRSSIWLDLSPKDYTLFLGSGPFKSGGLGYLHQKRQPLSNFFSNTSAANWESTHDHVLNGPISHISSPTNGGGVDSTGLLQFAVLYHVLDNENLQHWARVYYFPSIRPASPSPLPAGLEFKDVLLPGATWISTFSLEPKAILYSRDPDIYKFRSIRLPDEFTDAPHSELADPVISIHSEPGDRVHVSRQPEGIEDHQKLMSRMYSPIPDTLQVLTMDAYRTYSWFYAYGFLSENISKALGLVDHWISEEEHFLNDEFGAYSHEPLEYMAIVDGIHIQHEDIQLDMPNLRISRSKDAKVIAMSSIRYPLKSLTYTDGTDFVRSKTERHYLDQKNKPEIIYSEADMDKLDGDLEGLQLDDKGLYLAAWTDANQIFIFSHPQLQLLDGHEERYSSYGEGINGDEYDELGEYDIHMERWALRMIITSEQRALDHAIGTVTFITTSSGNYLLVGFKNGSVQSYSLDETEIQHPVNFWSFLTEQWNIWIPMAIVICLFVMSESQQFQRISVETITSDSPIAAAVTTVAIMVLSAALYFHLLFSVP